MTTVVTLMWGTAWERYGKTFADTFVDHWPSDVRLVVVVDKPLPIYGALAQPMLSGYPSLWYDNVWDNATIPADVPEKDRWKFDARKWAPQGIAPLLAARHVPDGEVMCWLDADVETLRDVPNGFVESLLEEHDVVHLGRPGKWSEIGFWACRMSPAVRAWIEDVAETWATGAVFDMAQWHSAWVFDRCLERSGLNVCNLTPNGRGHVWFQTELGKYMDHKKGARKDRPEGSPERAHAMV